VESLPVVFQAVFCLLKVQEIVFIGYWIENNTKLASMRKKNILERTGDNDESDKNKRRYILGWRH
jgi:Tfp pilus assembly protein PilO